MRNLVFLAVLTFFTHLAEAQVTYLPRLAECEVAVKKGSPNQCTEERLASFIQKHTAYQAINDTQNKGVMIAEVKVFKNGESELVEMKLGKGSVPDGSEEAIKRIIQDLKWLPARHNDRAIDFIYTIHVPFGVKQIKGKK